MRAFSLRNGELAVREVATPTPGSGQILVKTLACAICASDHHYNDHPEVSRDDKAGMRVDAPDCDVVMGHEYCAEIVEYGPDTERRMPVGTRVTGIPVLMTPRGQARIVGYAPDAPGGFGEYFLMNEFLARQVPESIPAEIIAVNDAMAVGWYYSRIGTENSLKKQSVPLVLGLGAIGLSVVAGLKRRGAGPIIAADFSGSRREIAVQLGADVAVDSAVDSPYDVWRQHAWGSPEPIYDYMIASAMKKQVVYECTGKDGLLTEVVDNCEFGARVLCAGGPAEDVIPSTVAHIKGLNFQYGGGPAMADWYGCLDLIVRGKLDPTPIVGETVTLDELPDAFERARSAQSAVRIVYKA